MSTETQHTQSGNSPPRSLDVRIADAAALLADLCRERDTLVLTADTLRPASSEVLRFKDAIKKMGWTKSWAYRNWERLGGYMDDDGRKKIRADVLARHVTKHEKPPR